MFDSLYPALDWLALRGRWPHAGCSQFVRTPNMRWHVQSMGSGPVAVLLHGTGASTHSWRAFMPLLAQRFQVIAVDLPGHGFSSPLQQGQRPTLPAVAQAVQALLAQLKLQATLWVGHSAGAAIAARCSLDSLRSAPQTSMRLVGLNPAWLPLPGTAQWLFPLAAWLIGHNPLAGWLAAKQAAREGAVARLLDSTGSHLDAEGLAQYTYLLQQPAHVRGVLQLMAHWDLQRLQGELPNLHCPVRLHIGLNDRTIEPAMADQALTLLPHATRRDWPGLGHLAHEEAPDASVQDIVTWFDGLSQTGH